MVSIVSLTVLKNFFIIIARGQEKEESEEMERKSKTNRPRLE